MRLFFSIAIFLFSVVAEGSPIDRRIQQEKSLQESSFSIIPHKPNYLLPFTYNENVQSYEVYQDILKDDENIQPYEIKFQISFKIPLFSVDTPVLPFSVFFGYTQASFWQAYNSDNSSPFRESNYEPELFAVWQPNFQVSKNWNLKLAQLNFTHQSNGQAESLSRSWNRIESSFVFENNNLTVAITPWLRIEEAASEDDNPDLLDYYGHGKISALYSVYNNTFTLSSRNNLESGFSKGSVGLDWSFPLGGHFRGYFQLFSGYGNSMIGYDEYNNTVGLGISLTDWL